MVNKTARVNNKALRALRKLKFPLYRVAESLDDEPENTRRLAGLPFDIWVKTIKEIQNARDENYDVYFEIQGRFQ